MKYVDGMRFGGRGTEAGRFAEALRGIAVDTRGRIHLVGDSKVEVFDAGGRRLGGWQTALPGFCVTVDADANVWVGEFRQVEIFGPDGTKVGTWTDPERLGLVTSVAVLEDGVLLADAGARWIRHYDRQGNHRNDIGDRHRKGGFHIPNGALDFAVDAEGLVHVANPGMHRVETYRPDGEYLGHFGRFDGNDPAGFPGCCNPTNLTLDAAGRVVVSEKATPRVKVYGAGGELLSVVADSGFDPQAKNLDLAVDSEGNIYVVDTARLEVRVFVPVVEGAADAGGAAT